MSCKLLPLVASLGALVGTQSARADVWAVVPSVAAEAVASDNMNVVSSGTAKADVSLKVTPELRMIAQGPRYRVSTALSGDVYLYLAGSSSNQFLPHSSFDSNLVAIDRWVYLDANLAADTITDNQQAASFQNSASNRTGITRQRLSPYIDHQFSPTTSIFARTDHTWVQTEAGAQLVGGATRSHVESDLVRYDVKPYPFGLRFEGSHVKSSGGISVSEAVVFDAGRVGFLYSPESSVFFGVTTGRDRGRYGGSVTSNTLRGVLLHWVPNERTLLDAAVERRFYGTGWNFRFSQHSPYMAISTSFNRQVSTYAAQLASLPAGGSIESLLNAAYSTRYTDPLERLTRVQSELANQGLPSNISGASAVNSGAAQMVQSADLAWLLMGVRHTLTTRVYRQSTVALLGPTDSPALALNDSKQVGLVVDLARRLNPQTTGTAELSYSRTDALYTNDGQYRINLGLRLGLSQKLSPKTVGTVGVRRQYSSSSVEGVADTREFAIYAGANHRF
jgi:uncharacterized protein (PEP-CTERM system associated)